MTQSVLTGTPGTGGGTTTRDSLEMACALLVSDRDFIGFNIIP